MKAISNKKQYAIVFIMTAVALIVYLLCYKFRLSQPIVLQEDKPIDNFIRAVALEGGAQSGMLAVCEYNVQNIIIFMLIKICGNVWAGINIYYILTFFMISISMYYFLSKLEIPAAVSAGLSVLASFVPFHVDRGEGQMMTSNFFLAPLFLSMFYDLVYCKKADMYYKKYVCLACIAPFIDIRISIMAIILFVVFLIQNIKSDFVKYNIVYLALLLSFSVFVGIISDTLKASDMELANEEGMRILDIVMPMRYHIVGFLSNRRLEYDVLLSAHGESGLNSLGVMFSLGFACMMFSLFFEWNRDRRVTWMGMIGMIVILVSGIRGIGSVIEYFGINVTYWSRMAVFITVCSVAVTGIAIGNVYRHIGNKYGKITETLCGIIVYVLFAAEFMEFILRQNM